MQTEEQTWRLAIEDEEAASGAVVEAEKVLHRQLQHHRAGSPTVDDAVSDLDLRRTEYAAAVHATDEAANVYYRAQGEAIASERDRRRADHVQRIEAVLQQARAEQQHAATTNPSVARRLYSSSSENGSPPRPTKRLNLGPPSSGPAIETTGSEQDTGRSGESDDSSSSGNASNPRHFHSTHSCLWPYWLPKRLLFRRARRLQLQLKLKRLTIYLILNPSQTVNTRSVPTRKTPTPDKAFCATAPPSFIAHLVGRIHRHGDVHTGQEVQERSAGAETYMQPSAGRRIPGQGASLELVTLKSAA
ncbi:hypothetical protein PR001_g26696 [Phytophthora rubi]|uniref:Uncharacterized protein n=1 Tax=Phytophthora rubi TaxID=129364 RepID=A0A6A3HTV9_9STRA|nr:hypothetical protein PR001_g26696 [Phytophthora rubi]